MTLLVNAYCTLRDPPPLTFPHEPSALADWARRSNAIVFMPDGSLLNPSGEELVDADGVPREDPGVLQERRHANNWLVRFEEADWDEVDTPT